MPFRPSQHRLTQRLGLLTLTLLLVMQSLVMASMPRMSASADDVVVICTGSGMQTLSLSALLGEPDANRPAPDSTVTEHCPLCVLAQALALPPTLNFVPATALDSRTPQAPPTDHAFTTRLYHAHQARAPSTSI